MNKLKSYQTIGHRALPTTRKVLANRKAATVLNDTISYHGARLKIEVLNPHRSRFFRDRSVTVASDRIVTLTETEVECQVDTHLVIVRLKGRRKGARPLTGALVSELSKKDLGRCPLLLEFDENDQFAGLTIFRSRPDSRSRRR
jgi:hypothetical protein